MLDLYKEFEWSLGGNLPPRHSPLREPLRLPPLYSRVTIGLNTYSGPTRVNTHIGATRVKHIQEATRVKHIQRGY